MISTTTYTQTYIDIAILHMGTYIAERWHRAHGFVCAGDRAIPLLSNSTYAQTLHRCFEPYDIQFEIEHYLSCG